MIINRSKTTMDNLVDLIKESNPGLVITASQFTVVSITPDATGQDNNTHIGIVATSNAGYGGTLDLWYKRASLLQGLINPITQIQRNGGETNAQVGARILAALNIKDSEVVINGGAGWGNDGVQTIATISNSLIYLPSQSYQVIVASAGILASINFNSAFLDFSIKNTFYFYGFSKVIPVFGSYNSQTGFSPADPDTLGFYAIYDATTGYRCELMRAPGSLSQDPTVARVYNASNQLIATFTGGVPGDPSTQPNKVIFPNPGAITLPTGVVLRVDFSLS